jgi:hypothetical protein
MCSDCDHVSSFFMGGGYESQQPVAMAEVANMPTIRLARANSGNVSEVSPTFARNKPLDCPEMPAVFYTFEATKYLEDQ